ncbi:MAG: hypothetical protein SGILL_003853, partial [Bacillariaceae sp.]
YSIVGALLYGGINPCIRGSVKNDNDDTDPQLADDTAERRKLLGSKVLKRFFDRIPLRLSTYLVKQVIDMRQTAIRQSDPDAARHPDTCPMCKETIQKDDALQLSTCGHVFCEECFWNDMLATIDTPAKLAAHNVVSCLVCGAQAQTAVSSVDDNTATDKVCFSALDPSEKREASLALFNRLPLNSKALKWSDGRKRKSKASERDHLASSWNTAVLPSLGSTQEVRQDKFSVFVEHNSLPYVNACLQFGVDVERKNEYGQTALYIAAWRGYQDLVEMLLDYGADATIVAHGGSTVQSVLRAHGYSNILDLMSRYIPDAKQAQSTIESTSQEFRKLPMNVNSELSLTRLIPETHDHPGAGSFLVDDTLNTEAAEILLSLFHSLPVEQNQKEKRTVALCSDRSYFCDAEGHVRRLLENILDSAMTKHQSTGSFAAHIEARVYPHMRFLNYTQPGTILAPHIDLCRVDPFASCDNQQQQLSRSTHTFILYLADCCDGGETCLLEDVSGDGREVVLAKIAPRRGRLLIFPHATPHEGLEVVDTPKILLRGEVQIMMPRPR